METSMAENHSEPHIVPVILCGGSGTRLWPLSREIWPKPFVELERGRSLFQETLERIHGLGCARPPVVVCNEAHRFHVSAALAACRREADIMLEPAPRNTAPAIALAALRLLDGSGHTTGAAVPPQCDPLMLVLPSDHAMRDAEAFLAAVRRAAPLAATAVPTLAPTLIGHHAGDDAAAPAAAGRIVTFGIEPSRPEPGFGYIQTGEPLEGGFAVARFVEKPDAAAARTMLATGGYLWNSGIFLMRASVYLAELARYAPEILNACRAAWAGHRRDGGFLRPDAKAFLASPENSIDYAVMERTALAAVTPLATDWNDLGSWEALYREGVPDSHGNVLRGDVLAEDVRNCYLHATQRLVAAVGLRDLIVVESDDAVLVLPRARAQEVKGIVARLRSAGREECRQHRLVHRPWGSYTVLALADRFQVKRIEVLPHASLSLQRHAHRAEHWVVVRGTAEVTRGDEVRLVTENQSTYIPIGTRHRLRNPGTEPLEIIEIQSGDYLGEDDIERFADDYGRD